MDTTRRGVREATVFAQVALISLALVALVLRDVHCPRVLAPTVMSHTALSALPAPGALRTLTGRVVGVDPGTIANTSVQAILVHDGRTWPLARTTPHGDGTFTLPSLPEGSYWLVARAPGRARAVVVVRVHGSDPEPVVLTVAAGAHLDGALHAHTRGEPKALAGAVVRAWREGAALGDDLPWVARTDAHGRFSLEGLVPGSYRIEVSAAGYESLRRVGVPAPGSPLSLTVRALAALEGVVRTSHGDGARGATVLLAGSGVWPPRTIPVLDDGRFFVQGLPSGVYELRANRDDDVADPIAPLVLEPGDRREVALTLGAGATLEAIVLDATTRRPIPGARVVLAEEALSTAPRALVADDTGRIRVPGLLRRPHQIAVRAAGYASRTNVSVHPQAGPVELPLDRAGVVEGRVLDGRGQPVANAQVELSVRDPDGGVSWLTGATVAFREALFDAQRRGPRPLVPMGELGVMPGRVPLIPIVPVPVGVQAEGVAPGFVTRADGTFRVEEVPPGVFTVTVQHPLFVRAESEGRLLRVGERAELTVVLHRGGLVEGRVVTERGFPMRGLQVELRSVHDPFPRRVFTLGDGTFRIPSVRGHVVLVALLGARVAARTEIDVGDDATVPVTLTVPGALRRIEGRVVDPRGFPVGGASVTITSLDRTALGTATTLTRPDGTFDTVLGGSRAVHFELRHPGFAPRSLRVEDPSRPVHIELGMGATLALTLRSDGCLTGPAQAELRTACGPVRLTVSDGEEVRAERLCAGRTTIVLEAPGCVRRELAVTVPSVGVTRLERIELRAGGAAEGDVVDARGDAVMGAVVARIDAPSDGITGTARSDRRGAFALTDLPEGDVSLVAWHPTLGRSSPTSVRVIRGTVARGLRLRFERDLTTATRALASRALTFHDTPNGVEVLTVAAGTAPERAGVRPGDQLRAVGAEPVRSALEAERRLEGATADDVVLELEREGVRRTVRYAREVAR